MATIISNAGAAGNWTAGTSWVGGVAPSATSDVVLQATTTSITIDSGAVCRSLTTTAFTGTMTHTAGVTLTIGDGTAGSGNVALAFGTFTYTLGNVATSAISFVSTSATVQTVNFNGKTTGNVTFNATSNGSWQYIGGHVTGATATVTLTKGTLDINGQTCSWGIFTSSNSNTRSLTLGSSNITLTGSNANVFELSTKTNATLSMASGNFTTTGLNAKFFSNGNTHGNLTMQGGGTVTTLSSGSTFNNVTITGTAAKTDIVLIGDCTVGGIFTVNGNSTINRVLIQSTTVGTSRTITAATVSVTNTDFQDITGAGLADWDFNAQTDIGDCGGNSNIIFPASVSQTWNGASGGNWSTNAWTTRVPLPQDSVSLGVAFSASQTVVCDMPRLGGSISWIGATGSPTWNFGSVANSVYGSIDLTNVGTISGTQVLTLAGRGNYTLTNAGKTYTQNLVFTAPTGTYTLSDSLICGFITLNNGTLDNSGNNNVTATGFTNSATTTRTVIMGTATWTLNGGGVTPLTFVATGLTKTGSSETIVISLASASTRTFAGGGLTYGTLTYTVAGSTGELDITGSNSFAQINFSDASNARSLKFTKATNTTIRNGNGFNVRGTAGKLMTIDTIDGAGVFTMTSSNVQSTDYINVNRSVVDASPKWYAGANSTDNDTDTNWIYTAPQSSFVQGRGFAEAEYAFLARHNQIYSGSLNSQRITFYNSKSGSNEKHVESAELAFLKYKTGINTNNRSDLWRSYLVSLGYENVSSLSQMKYSFFCGSDTV